MRNQKERIKTIIMGMKRYQGSYKFDQSTFAIGYEHASEIVREFVKSSTTKCNKAEKFLDEFSAIKLSILKKEQKEKLMDRLLRCEHLLQYL